MTPLLICIVVSRLTALVLPDSSDSLRVPGGTTAPEALTRVRPIPAPATGWVGKTVTISAHVGSDGRVKDARITRSVPGLDSCAREAVLKWLFRPARAEDGSPPPAWVTIPVSFQPDQWVGEGWVDRPPEPTNRPAMVELHPEGSRLEGLETLRPVVVVHVLVAEDGHVIQSRVVRSIPIFDKLAEASAGATKFAPAMSGGRPVRAWAALTIRCRFRVR